MFKGFKLWLKLMVAPEVFISQAVYVTINGEYGKVLKSKGEFFEYLNSQEFAENVKKVHLEQAINVIKDYVRAEARKVAVKICNDFLKEHQYSEMVLSKLNEFMKSQGFEINENHDPLPKNEELNEN